MRYGTCFLCGKTGWLEEHHVYPGPFRDKSEKYGLKVGLCGESCHRNGRYAAHQCRETSDALKQFWQIKYMMAHKASVADFRAAFGKNYLELDYYSSMISPAEKYLGSGNLLLFWTMLKELLNGHESNINDLLARVKLLELILSADVTGNPYYVTFNTLTDVVVSSGIWNEADGRIEF